MTLYHYCSNQALVSIVESKQLRLSDLSLSNDYLEGKWMRNIIAEYCTEKFLGSTDLDMLLRFLDSLIRIMGAAGFCLSENGDLLSQWRGYADEGRGVSIGFRKDYLEELANSNKTTIFRTEKIVYDPGMQRDELQSDMDIILKYIADGAFLAHRTPSILESFNEDPKAAEKKTAYKKASAELYATMLSFVQYFYVFKNPAFSEEAEWRLISYLLKGPKENDTGMMHEANFFARGDRIIPYVTIELSSQTTAPISEIIMGPRNNTPENVVAALLKKSGFEEVEVKRSAASYR